MYYNKPKKYKKNKKKVNINRVIVVVILSILTGVIVSKAIMGLANRDIVDGNTEGENIIGNNENEDIGDSEENINNSDENYGGQGIEIEKNIPLVNKEYGISKNYEPNDLRVFNELSNKTIMLREEAADYAERLFQDAADAGVYLMAAAGYRSYEYQEELYRDEVQNFGQEYANKYVARPGHSEHHTGLAIDLMRASDVSLREDFDETYEFKWLMENMSDYGFILRYPKGKETITGYNYESWHIRYVGVEVAKEIEESGLTLEEYLSK